MGETSRLAETETRLLVPGCLENFEKNFRSGLLCISSSKWSKPIKTFENHEKSKLFQSFSSWALHKPLVRMMKKILFSWFLNVFHRFWPCKRMGKHVFAGWNTQHRTTQYHPWKVLDGPETGWEVGGLESLILRRDSKWVVLLETRLSQIFPRKIWDWKWGFGIHHYIGVSAML